MALSVLLVVALLRCVGLAHSLRCFSWCASTGTGGLFGTSALSPICANGLVSVRDLDLASGGHLPGSSLTATEALETCVGSQVCYKVSMRQASNTLSAGLCMPTGSCAELWLESQQECTECRTDFCNSNAAADLRAGAGCVFFATLVSLVATRA